MEESRMREPTMLHRLAAEFIGTFWLVFGGCGAAVFAANPSEDVSVGIGFLGVALAFGLTVLTGVYAFGTISGGHFNPAVTLGAALARRVEWKAVPGYWIVQVIGGLVAGLAIYWVAKGKAGFNPTGHMAANGFGDHSPFGYSMSAVIVVEVLLTFVFLLVILGVELFQRISRLVQWYEMARDFLRTLVTGYKVDQMTFTARMDLLLIRIVDAG